MIIECKLFPFSYALRKGLYGTEPELTEKAVGLARVMYRSQKLRQEQQFLHP